MYWIIYGNSRAKSTEDLLRSVLLLWMVEPLPYRSCHKRDQEIFRAFLSSINILNTALNILKKLALITVDVFVRSYKPNSHLPWRKVWIVYEGFLRTDLSRFSKYIYWWFAFQCFLLISRVILAKPGDFFRPAPSRFPPPLFMFFWRRDPPCFKPNVIKYYHRINKSTLKNRFFSERLKIAQNTAKIDADL